MTDIFAVEMTDRNVDVSVRILPVLRCLLCLYCVLASCVSPTLTITGAEDHEYDGADSVDSSGEEKDSLPLGVC